MPSHPFLNALHRIERAGNQLPHPTLLFAWLCLLVIAISVLSEIIGLSATHPLNGEHIQARSLFSAAGLQWWLRNAVTNFTSFGPVGTVLVAMLGIGIAERSGLLGTALQALVSRAPGRLLSASVVLAGVLSSIAADAGYVVLIPLAALLFKAAGRHPLIGIAAAFAGVSGGFSANLIIGPIDAIMAGISSEAIGLVEPGLRVQATANYYVLVASTFLITIIGAWVTERLIAPRFEPGGTDTVDLPALSADQRRGLRTAGVFTLVFAALVAWASIPAGAPLRAEQPSATAPLVEGIVVLIAVYAALAGICYGRVSGALRGARRWVEAMEGSMADMAGYLVLMFFAAQFVNAFDWTRLGSIAAITGADTLGRLDPGPVGLMLGLILLSAGINLLIGSASAKWALMAPIFVPMFYLLGLSPEASQMAYRVGDSSTNIITPLMPYFGVVVAFAQRHDPNAGVGTIMALMLPYSVCFLLAWSALLGLWIGFDWPLGPGATLTGSPPEHS